MKAVDIPAWPTTVPHDIQVPETNLCFNLQVGSMRYGPVALLHDDAGSLSYAQAWEAVERLAAYLQASLRIGRGDRVLMFMQNSRAFLLAYFAILRIGGVVVPINPMNRRVELAHYLADARVSAAFCDAGNAEELCHSAGVERLAAIVVDGLQDGWTSTGAGARLVTPFARALACDGTPGPLLHEPDEVSLILYSSGTTGAPKGCMHTHRSLLASASIVAHWQQIHPGSVSLAALPWFHITGMQNLLNAPVYGGATIVLLKRWDRDAAAALIARHRVTHWTAMPTMVIDFLASPALSTYDLGSIRRIGGGGAAMPEAVSRQLFEATGLNFLEGYGLSETAHALGNPADRFKRQCLGMPLFNTDVRIMDPETLELLEAGAVGEILISGPQVFQGYWNNAQATTDSERVIEGRRFVRTGDLGRFDEEGYFFIVDRLKRMVNASGYKVWPAEVEAMLHEHPDVQEACVIAAQDPYRGETVKAVVVLRNSGRGLVTEAEIIEWSRQRMAAYKYPRIVEFVPELPKSPTGKIAWRALQEHEQERARRFGLKAQGER